MTPPAFNIEQTIHTIKLGKIIAIIRGDYSLSKMVEIGDALLASPVPAMEVTLNSRDALEAIAALRDRAGSNMLVGAGTVRTVKQANDALAAGAQFLVSPGFNPTVTAYAQKNNLLHLPGVFTPTEVETAIAAGCQMVKLFPANTGGPAYLKTLRAPLDNVDFVPTGGITIQNLAEYVMAGAAAVGVGSSLVSNLNATMAEIISNARMLQSTWKKAARHLIKN